MFTFLEYMRKYFMKAIIALSVCTLLWGAWFQYIHKGNWDDFFGYKLDKTVYLTLDSMSCIAKNCHGTGETKSTTINTAWGKQTWNAREYVYVDPHAKIKPLKKSFFVNTAYAGIYAGLGNHPVGVPYPIGKGEYRYPPLNNLLLPNGYIQCESCHLVVSPSEGQHGELVMSNEGSRLCLACHIK